MLAAAWLLATATTLLAATSIVAVLKWAEDRRHTHEASLEERFNSRIASQFASKDLAWGIGIGVVVVGAIAWGVLNDRVK